MLTSQFFDNETIKSSESKVSSSNVFYKKEIISPKSTSSSIINRPSKQFSHHKGGKRNDDRINKGVSHKIKKPKIPKTKEKKKSKNGFYRMREVKMPPTFPSDRSPLTPGDKKKLHLLTSPGCSLLDSPDSAVEEEHSSLKKKFFTSRSSNAASVQICKTIKLSAQNGNVKINQREGGFQKKNIGHTIELELEKKIAAATLNSPINNYKLQEIGQVSASPTNVRSAPTRFLGSPSPAKNKKNMYKGNNYSTPLRSSPRRHTLKIIDSPSRLNSVELRVSPRRKSNLVDSLTHSLVKETEQTKPFMSDNHYKGEEELEDLDLALEKLSSNKCEEDEILSTLLKENVSPEKIINSPRRSPRKHHATPNGKLINSPSSKSLNRNQDYANNESHSEINDVGGENNNENVKYFPVFNRSRKLNNNHILNKKQKNSNNALTKWSKKLDDSQMILDVGQKDFGGTFCRDCGFFYEIGEPSDEIAHLQFHDGILSTLKFTGWKTENRVTNLDKNGGFIIKISPKDPPNQWRKIRELLTCVDKDLGFSQNGIKTQSNTFAYLYILGKQIVGCLICESIDKAYKIVQQNTALNGTKESSKLICCSEVAQKVCMGISRIWVFSAQRRKGIATALVDAMRYNSVYGVFLSMDQFAFSDPTEFGLAFAQKYTDRSDFLVYRRESEDFLKQKNI